MPKVKAQSDRAATSDELPLHDINNDPELVRLRQLEESAKEQRACLYQQLQDSSYVGGFGSRELRYDAGADAERLLAGEPLDNLVAPVQQSEYAQRMRQFRALEALIPRIAEQRQETYFRLCQEELTRLRPVLADAYGGVLDAFDRLLVQIRRYHDLVTTIHQHGLHSNILALWELTALEHQLAYGGNNNPALDLYIRIRRTALGLDEGK